MSGSQVRGAADMQRQLADLQEALAQQQRLNLQLEGRNRSLMEQVSNGRQAKAPQGSYSPMAGVAPFVQVGHAPQPQQPVSVSVGVKAPQPRVGAATAQQQQPPAAQEGASGPSQRVSPQAESSEPTARERQLMQELAEKNALLEKYRARTRGMSLGIETPASPPAPPAGGPGAKATPSRPRASLGTPKSLLTSSLETRDTDAERSPSRRGTDVGVQVGTLTADCFCQTDEGSQVATYLDQSGNSVDAVLQGSRLCDAMGRLPTSRAINVNLFMCPGSNATGNGSFSSLPPPAGADFASSTPPHGAATLPLAAGSSWSDEPAPVLSATMPIPSRGSGPAHGSPKRGRGRGGAADEDAKRRGKGRQ